MDYWSEAAGLLCCYVLNSLSPIYLIRYLLWGEEAIVSHPETPYSKVEYKNQLSASSSSSFSYSPPPPLFLTPERMIRKSRHVREIIRWLSDIKRSHNMKVTTEKAWAFLFRSGHQHSRRGNCQQILSTYYHFTAPSPFGVQGGTHHFLQFDFHNTLCGRSAWARMISFKSPVWICLWVTPFQHSNHRYSTWNTIWIADILHVLYFRKKNKEKFVG